MYSVIVGGAGNLGRSFVYALKNANIKAISIDLNLSPNADFNILVKPEKTLHAQINDIISDLSIKLDGRPLSSVFCTAGGWKSGSISDIDFLEKISLMHTVNVETSATSCHIASRFVSPNGLLMLTGASVALHPTPSTLAYGISKASTHFMVQSVANDPHFIRNRICVLGVLPEVIDTSENRMRFSNANSKDWTKPEEISKVCVEWITDPSTRPKTGSLLNVKSSVEESKWNE